MKPSKKRRHPKWWWGRYIQKINGRWFDENGRPFPATQYNEAEFEDYVEDKHGSKNNDTHVRPS